MTTNFPASEDTFVRPVSGDALNNSDGAGKLSTGIIDDVQGAVEAIEAITVGPAFTSVKHYTAVAESVINLGTATTNFVGVNTSAPAVATTGSQTCIAFANANWSWDNNPNLTTKGYLNISAGTSRGTKDYIAIDIYGPASQDPHQLYFEAFCSSAVDMGGTVLTGRLPNDLAQSTWTSVYVDVRTLSSVRCIGIRSYAKNIQSTTKGTISIRNIRWAAQTELQVALESGTGGVLVPKNYTPSITQRPISIPSTRNVLDLRGTVALISNSNGSLNMRQFQVLGDDGSVECSAQIQAAFDMLHDHDRLVFPSNGTYWVDHMITLPPVTDVIIDGQGCRFFSKQDRGTSFFSHSVQNGVTWQNLAVFGYRAEPALATIQNNPTYVVDPDHPSNTFAAMTVLPNLVNPANVPAISGTTYLLDNQGEMVAHPSTDHFARDYNSRVICDFVLSDTTQAPNDCKIEFVDKNAPTAPVTLALYDLSGSPVGALRPSTYYYRVSFVDKEGHETGPCPAASITFATRFNNVTLTFPAPPASSVPWDRYRIYRTKEQPSVGEDLASNYNWVDDVLMTPNAFLGTQTYVDTKNTGNTWNTNQIPPTGVLAAGSIPAGQYYYAYTNIRSSDGAEGDANTIGHSLSLVPTVPSQATITLPAGPAGTGSRRIYRTKVGRGRTPHNFFLVGTVNDNAAGSTFVDNQSDATIGANISMTEGIKTSRNPLVFSYRYLTLTATPTTYRLEWDPGRELQDQLVMRVSKNTATANTITVTSITAYGHISYTSAKSSFDGGTIESAEAFRMADGSAHIRFENVWVEGVGGDFTNVAGNNLRDISFYNCLSRGCRRQGLSVTGGADVVIDHMRIWEPARTGIDVEPFGQGDIVQRLTIHDTDVRNPSNYGISCNNWERITNLDVARFTHSGNLSGTGGAFLGGAINGSIRDINAPYQGVSLTGINLFYDQIACASFRTNDATKGAPSGDDLVAGGYVGGIVRITPLGQDMQPVRFSSAASTLGLIASGEAVTFPVGNVASPFSMYADSKYGVADPGQWGLQFPSTYDPAAMVLGPMQFPNGLDLRSATAKRVRGISSSATPANNLGGTLSVSAGALTGTVTFPSRTYANPSSFSLQALTGGTLAAGTYFYRVAGRPRLGGPIVALSQQSIALSGANTAVNVQIHGLQGSGLQVQGLTIYRGTTSGVYTARYDIVPNSNVSGDFAGLGGLNDAIGDNHYLSDLGTTIADGANGVQVGYTFPVSQTAHVTSGSYDNFVVQDETGNEADASYRLWFTPSWDTTVAFTAKRNNGFDVRFGVACPTGGGTVDWGLMR